MLVNRLIQSISTFVLTASIARTLGAYELGQYLLAFSYYFIFVTIASQGLKTLCTRELSRNPQEMPVYLGSGIFLQMLLSIISYIAMVVFVFVLPYNPDTSTVCYIMGLAIIPFSLSNITEALFQAQEKMNLIAISTVPVYILRLLVMLWFMHLNYGVNYLAGIFVISELLIFVLQWILLTRIVKPRWQIKKDFIWHLFKSARTFLAIDAVGIISSRMSVLIISLLGSEVMVGIDGAIGQLLQPYSLIVSSIGLAAFPRITKAVVLGREKSRQVTENIIEMLSCIGLPFIVGVFFIGNDLLQFVYKNLDFNDVDLVLKVTALSVIFSPFIRTFSYVLLANGLEKFNLLEVSVTNFVGALSGVVLISQYQLIGAGFMYVLMSLTAFSLLIYVLYSRLFSLNFWRIMRRPLLITFGMIGVFLLLKNFNFNLLSTLLIGTCAYCVFATGLTIHTLGGIHVVWKKLFNQGVEKI
jgi:O-antigen/teichoic acid export membrane protein